MNPNIKNNVLTWAVVVLIIANIVVITLFWLGHRQIQRRQETPADFLSHELGLDDKQKAQLHEFASQHHMESEKIRQHIKEARDHFFDLIKMPNVNPATKDSAANAIADNLKKLELLTFDHFQKVRMMCTPDQQVKFDKIINQVIKMVAGPPPGRPPHGRRGGPDGPPPGPPGDRPPRDRPPGDTL